MEIQRGSNVSRSVENAIWREAVDLRLQNE